MNACGVCRKQKLRCDGGSPACGRCARLGHQCIYDESRRKSGPRRGYVKGLETRLDATAQVEALLKKYEPVNERQSAPKPVPINTIADNNELPNALLATYETTSSSPPSRPCMSDDPLPQAHLDTAEILEAKKLDDPFGTEFSWEIVELGLEEPLPLQEVLEDLTHIYFANIHPSVPIIHQYRFLAALNLSPNTRPPIALRYAMWTLAASVTIKYQNLHELFYTRARKYAELVEMSGHGEKVASTALTQAWILIGIYELKMMYYPRVWLSTGRAVRLAQMIGMHRVDGLNSDLKQTLSPPRDWIEKEERRRTFWMAFCMDRYATVGTGWPVVIDEEDIHTHLPCSEEAYGQGQETTTVSLEDALRPSGAAVLSPFAGVVVVATLFGRVLRHLHKPAAEDSDDEANSEFWKRHRNMDNMLLSTALYLPPHLRLPVVSPNPNTVFLHMCLHGASICLHQVALFKAEKNKLSSDLITESSVRCFTAAAEITRVMRMIAHTNLEAMHPFLPFCIFLAARVFIQHVKLHPNDHDTASSIRFLLSAMTVMQVVNPLAASFLVQLDVELEGTGLEAHPDEARYHRRFDKSAAELDKQDLDGFTVYVDASPRAETLARSDASSNRAEEPPAERLDSAQAKSPLPKPKIYNEERSGGALQYQYLPVRNMVVSNYGLSAHHEFQTKQNLSPGSSATLPILAFDETISGSNSEMDMTPDGIRKSNNVYFPEGSSVASSSQAIGTPFPGEYATSGGPAASCTSRSQSYMSQTPGTDVLGSVTEESWDFGDMDDLYDTIMNTGPGEQEALKRQWTGQ